MSAKRSVKLFKNGRNQAVRIPRDFELPGTDAVMTKDGDRLIIEAKRRPSFLEALRSLKPIRERLPKIERSPPEPVDL
ncbi:MAG: AbrB/MazE/SpoVT family DNA-binding domain-containing protein [Rhodospirillaceae bacterium]|nr:AbrB/MazE/SpoVT family DNA-binding domain-containing protein [Rhodospirillaceae bacterium]